MTAAGSVERQTGLPLIGKELAASSVCLHLAQNELARSGPRFSWCLPKKDLSDQDVKRPQAWLCATSMRTSRSARGFESAPCLELACCCALFAAVI